MAENAVNTEQGVILEALNYKADLDGNNLTGTGFEDYIKSLAGSSGGSGGYKVQGGYAHLKGTATGSSYSYSYTGTITFPEPFDTECLSIVLSDGRSFTNATLTNTGATGTFVAYNENFEATFYWIAIGR